jgi:alpha-beta hydrolase superfamily lysophospholipase
MTSRMTMRSAYDDLDISVLMVEPEDSPRAVIQLAHGVCGCKERFLPMMEYMARKGIACVAGDHRGHGESIKAPEDLGYMYDGGYKALVSDMRMITRWAHERFPGLPLYLVGHSMGSMAARVYAKEDDSQIDGLILCGSPSWNPMSSLGRAVTWIMCHMGLSRHRMSQSMKLSSERLNRKFESEGYMAWTCSDPKQRKEFADNPTCNFHLTANGTYNLLSLMTETYSESSWAVTNPDMPIVFISGEQDPMMLDEKKFHMAAYDICRRGYINVSSAIYPGMRHEVLNEIGKEEIWNDILSFIK